MKEADREDEGSPLVIWLYLFKEILVDHSIEGPGKTSLETHWWLCCDFDSHLEETKWEFGVWLTSDPESEVLVNLLILWIEIVFHLCHEFKTQMAIV